MAEDAVHRGAVADVGLFEGVKRAVGHAGDVVEAGGIGQLVDIDDAMPARHGKPHHRRADEPRAARDQKLSCACPLVDEGAVEARERARRCILVGQDRGGVAEAPVDPDVGVIESQRPFGLGGVDCQSICR